MVEPRSWKITNKNIGSKRGLLSDFFGDISNRKIEGIGRFIAECSDLSFVGGDDERDNGTTWIVSIELLLKSVSHDECPENMN